MIPILLFLCMICKDKKHKESIQYYLISVKNPFNKTIKKCVSFKSHSKSVKTAFITSMKGISSELWITIHVCYG